MFSNDATVHPWGEEKKKSSFWRRLFKKSKPKEYIPSLYTPSPFAPSTFERSTAYGVPAYQVPQSNPYDMYSSSNLSSDRFSQSQASSYWNSPPHSPISSRSLASSRSDRPSVARSNTGFSSTNSFMHSVEEEQLVLTLTSKYPTGIAADLYVPETTIVPEDKSIGRSLSNKSYLAKHAILRTYDRHTSRISNKRQSWHF